MRPHDPRPRCPHCRRVLRHPDHTAPFVAAQIGVCQSCGRPLPELVAVQCLYEGDEVRRLAELLIAGGGDRDDAVALARLWLSMFE